MLGATVSLHREYLLAQTPNQKLFLLLKLSPQANARSARPDLALAFVVDTSGSMREVVTEPTEWTGETRTVDGKTYNIVRGAKTKMDLVIESLRAIFGSDFLRASDRVSLVKFDDTAEVLVPFTNAAERVRLIAAAERLDLHSGGTQMGAGMQAATTLLEAEQGNRRMIVLTDGQTFDETVVQQEIERLAALQVPVTTVGVGDEVNTNLLIQITDRTQGKPIDVVPDNQNPQPPAIRTSDLPAALLDDLRAAASEVVTGVGLTVRTVKDVVLERVTRVHPTQTEVDRRVAPLPLGNVEAGAGATFVLEFTLPPRPPARMRLAQLGLTYQVPGANYRGEIPPLDVVVEFTHNESLTARIDPDVMQWVQQRNIEQLVLQATREAQSSPEQAQKTLALARTMTQRLSNGAMTVALDRAIQELDSSKTLSLGTAKTLKLGAKTQTIRASGADLPNDDDIRKLTGA